MPDGTLWWIPICAHIEDLDQPAHSHSLFRVFNGHRSMNTGSKGSDRADVRIDLNFLCIHLPNWTLGVRPSQTQTSLRIRAVWPESSMGAALCITKGLVRPCTLCYCPASQE